MVIYASKKFWFSENRPYGIHPYVRPPLLVSRCEMAHFNTICVKLGIGHPCCDQLTAVVKGIADQCHMTASRVQVYVVVNFLSQLFFIFPLF